MSKTIVYFVSVFLVLLLALTAKAQLDAGVSIVGDYAQESMIQLAATPPLLLLKNEKGKSRHEILGGYLKLSADDDITLSSGTAGSEAGDGSGVGLGYGYSKSFVERWAYYVFFQFAVYSGEHNQFAGSTKTTSVPEMDGATALLAFGVSYEFFRESDFHTLNVFAGPGVIHFMADSDVQTFNETTGAIENSITTSISTTLPLLNFGLMYEAAWFEKWQIVFYGMGLVTFEECAAYEVNESPLVSSNSFSSPECDASSDINNAETDIATTFATLGFKVKYRPWNLGFNISSFFRNLIFKEDNPNRAEVNGVLLSISRDWGSE